MKLLCNCRHNYYTPLEITNMWLKRFQISGHRSVIGSWQQASAMGGICRVPVGMVDVWPWRYMSSSSGSGRGSALVVDGRISSPVVDGRCPAPMMDGRCLAPVVDGRCSAPVVDGRNLDPAVYGRCLAPVVDVQLQW